MAQASEFISRTGNLTCTPAEVFEFVTDMRNFKRFVPDGSVDKMDFSRDECSFYVASLGNVIINIDRKSPYSDITYNATLLRIQDLSLVLNINGSSNEKATVVITVSAEMNPFMKLMAEKYITKFLEAIIEEMENFRDWKQS